MVQNIQPMNYRVEELRPPLAPRRKTKIQFEEVEMCKRKEEYTVQELKQMQV